jgi:hypothetical protein
MHKNLIKILSLILIVANSSLAFASGVEKLMKYATPAGSMSNINKGAIINDQQGGYVTGGSAILRAPRPITLQPLVVQTPKFAYDACTGSADFRFGGISYISGKEFTQFFKNVATASGAYAAKMFIKSANPQIENIMSDLEAIARDVNGMMMDQCGTAQMIAGGVYNALNSGNQQTCMMQSNINKSSRDMYEATDKCKSNPDRHGDTGKNDELKSMLGNEFNLVWKALSKTDGSDLGFKELILSVSGTIIGRKVEESFQFTNKPSLVLNNDLLEQYIGVQKKAGRAKLYQCDTKDKCLSPVETEVVLQEKDTIYGNISRILTGLIPKISTGKGILTDEEEAIISFSSVPIIQLIEMEIVSKASTEDMLVRTHEFLEVISYDIVTNFLSNMLQQVSSAVAALEYSQLDNTVIQNFNSQVVEIRRFITDSKFAAFKRLQVVTQYKERLSQQQRAFEGAYSRFLEQNFQG